MRIGIDIRELERDKMTGIGRYILNFLGYVSRYDQNNEYILFGNQKTFCPILGAKITLKIIPEFSKIHWDQIVLAKQIDKEKLDIFFSPYYKSPLFSRVKKIVTAHDVYPFLKYGFEPLFKNLIREYYYKVMFYNADLIIAVSESIKEIILKVSKLNPEKIKVVYNSINDRFRVSDKRGSLDKIRQIYGIKKKFILYIGNFKPHKNVERLIQAYSQLRPNLRDRYQLLLVAGKDRYFLRLHNLVKENKLENDVIFTGLVQDDSLVYLYNAATLYISISLHEGFGLPFVEAMACGTPVIGANLTAIPEIVKDAGLLVNPYDIHTVAKAIERLLEDDSLREELIQKGLLRAKQFSLKAQIEKIIATFKEI